jgi:PAS domain-containing protein
MKANLPVNEVDRLLAVEQTGLMDSAPDDEFDCLVRLASVVCETPIALVTLVDHRRQWFKARIGLESTETSRDIAFCAHTILQPDLFQVRDATLDPRFCDNPLVTGELGIRFYAGVPLNTAEGLHVGTLCVIDRSPRDLLPGQLEALHLLADQVKKHINLRTQRNMLAIALAATSTVEQELRRSQSLFHAFMDHAPFLGFMKDAEGKLVYYNQRLADRFSIGRQDWVGKGDALATGYGRQDEGKRSLGIKGVEDRDRRRGSEPD